MTAKQIKTKLDALYAALDCMKDHVRALIRNHQDMLTSRTQLEAELLALLAHKHDAEKEAQLRRGIAALNVCLKNTQDILTHLRASFVLSRPFFLSALTELCDMIPEFK